MFAYRRIKASYIPPFDCVAAGVRLPLAERQSNLNAFVRGDFVDCSRPCYKLVVSSYNELFEHCASLGQQSHVDCTLLSPLACFVPAVSFNMQQKAWGWLSQQALLLHPYCEFYLFWRWLASFRKCVCVLNRAQQRPSTHCTSSAHLQVDLWPLLEDCSYLHTSTKQLCQQSTGGENPWQSELHFSV